MSKTNKIVPRPQPRLFAVLRSFCLVLLGAFLTLPSHAQTASHVKVQLKWHHQFQFAGYYAAQARGFYREHGLDVEIIEGDAQHPPISEVLNGNADFGVSDADVLKAYLDGKPLVVLASIFQHSPYILMTRADRGLRTPSDLRGKTIMLADEQGIAQIKAMFRREGMSLDSVRILPHQWNNQLLIDGQVDAISAYSTVEPFQLQAKGVEPAMIRALDYGVDFYGDTIFTTRNQVKLHPARVAAFRDATLKGWEYAMAHPEEMIELILKMPGVKERGITREALRYEANAMRELILPGLVDIGHMNPGRWETIARIYKQVGWIDTAPTGNQLASFLYDPSGGAHLWRTPLLIGLGFALIVALWILLWNAQLRRAVAQRTVALQRAEQLLRYHVENSPLAVVEWDHQFRVSRWTGQAEQVFGWSAKEVLGKHPSDWDFVHPDDRAATDHVMRTLLNRSQRRNRNSNRNLRKDGSVVECEWYNSGSVDENGKLASILSLALDVTERNRAQRSLEALAEQRRVALEAGRLGAWEYCLGTQTVQWDETCQQMFGTENCPVIAYEGVIELIHPHDRPHVVAAINRALAGQNSGSYDQEYRVTWPDGSIHWIASHGRVYFKGEDHDQQPFRFVGVNAEITEAKRAEAALRESEERFRGTFENAAVGIANVSVDGAWLAVNQKLGDIVGYSREELLQRTFQSITAPEDLEKDLVEFNAMLRGEIDTYSLEKRYIHKAGHPIWVMLTVGARRNAAGQLIYCVSVMQDISERKRAQKALYQTQEELARSNATLERRVQERTAKLQETVGELEHFSYTITHDMRAPLRSMEAFGKLLMTENARQLDDRGKDLLRRIVHSAKRMDHLIRDALNYSKVVKTEMELSPVDLGALVRSMVESYPEFQAPRAQVEIIEPLPEVLGNAAGLTQCFSNLLVNAVKFVRPAQNPRVRIWAEPTELSDGVRIWIEDNGIGIQPEYQNKIFQMFHRLDKARDGTGIGLALVRKVVERMKGRVGVESQPGQGSRFWVELKVAPQLVEA